MASKSPAQVNKFPDDSTEAIAYKIAGEFSTRESNDNNRLGYHIYRYLKGTIPTLEEAVRVSGVRLTKGETLDHVIEQIAQRLKDSGTEAIAGRAKDQTANTQPMIKG